MAVHRPPDPGVVHDVLPRRLLLGLRLVHDRLLLNLHGLLRDRLHVLLVAVLTVLLDNLLRDVVLWVVILRVVLCHRLWVVLRITLLAVLLWLWFIANFRRRTGITWTWLLAELLGLIVAPNHMNSQSIPCLGCLWTVWTLVKEATDVCLNVLLHSGSDLAGEVTLSALPTCLSY